MCDASCVANERTMRVGELHSRVGRKEGRTEGVVSRNLEKKTAQGPQSCARREEFFFDVQVSVCCPKRGERPISCGIKHQFRAEWMALFFDVHIDGRRAAGGAEMLLPNP